MEKLTTLIATTLTLVLALAAVPAYGASGVVNINDADAGQLALLPRVGPALSERIIEFREENGEFKSPEDLMLVRGIGEKTFEMMAPFIIVEGKTTLDGKVRQSDLEREKEKEEQKEKDSDR
jgi:competence protein ComEA